MYERFFDKLSSYNIFNNLLPGVLFAVLISEITSYKVLQSEILTGVFVYYFFGVIVSRVGSIVIKPILEKLRIVTLQPYEEYVRVSKVDPKLELLLEVSNMYRTLCALLFLVAVVFMYDFSAQHFHFLNVVAPYICIFSLLILFIFSYKKQNAYVVGRISASQE